MSISLRAGDSDFFTAAARYSVDAGGAIPAPAWRSTTPGPSWYLHLAADLVQHAFLYIGIVMLELVIWLDPLSGAGRVAAEAKRIDDAGLIVANGVKAGVGNGALVLTPVPEPSSFVPMAGGLVVMAFIARRRRRDNSRSLVLRGLARLDG